jgi:hypothetical protein
MKGVIISFLALSTLLFLGSSAAAQHGRPAGRPGPSGSMGASGTHGNSSSAGAGHASSNAMASTNAGSVLEHNSNLSTKLETLTGATTVADLKADASAFKNFGQFVAAAHVAKNLNIPGGFTALMCDMTTHGATVGGTASTCSNTTKMSLGKAIQTLDPQADSKTEAKKAMNQANQDLRDSSGS